MCTVTYIPKGKNEFVLTSNRDENPSRSPKNITRLVENRGVLIFPRDKAAGGTWIAASEKDRIICLLNGAFEYHRHDPPYRMSRGIMVLDYFNYPSASSFFDAFPFSGMEPFTMIIIERGQLIEFRWDGACTHVKQLDTRYAYIWSSASLYPAPIREKREKWFAEWMLGRVDFSIQSILDFHRYGGEGDSVNDLTMNRGNIVKTVSITSIVKEKDQIKMIYHDLIRDKNKHQEIQIQSGIVESS